MTSPSTTPLVSTSNDKEPITIPPVDEFTILPKKLASRATNFQAITMEEVRRLPLWNDIQRMMESSAQGGRWEVNVVTQGEYLTHAYVSNAIVPMALTQNPVVNTFSGRMDVDLTNTVEGGTATVTVTSGYTSSSQMSVAQAASVGGGVTASVSVGVPGLISGEVATTVNTSVTNEIGRATSTTVDNTVAFQLGLPIPAGHRGFITYTVTTAYANTEMSIQILCAGAVVGTWRTEFPGGHHEGCHVFDLASWPEQQRSSWMRLQGVLNSRSDSNFVGHTEPR